MPSRNLLPSRSVHVHLQRLAAVSLLAFVLGLAASTWIALQGPQPAIEDPLAWAFGLSLACTLTLPFLFAAAYARCLSASIASLDAVAKALVVGAEARVPQGIAFSEAVHAAEKLVHGANVVRAREFALRSADRVKDEFLATLAHELRNPLSAMAAGTYLLRSMLKDAPASPEREAPLQPLEIIDRQVQQMTRLIEDLLDVARITRGKASLSRQPLDLAAAAHKAVDEMRLAGRLDEHELRIETTPAWVRADEARMQQLITNLVGNAVKYTPSGGRITVTVRRDRDEAILRVQDSGVGMSPELAARVFDLFVQGEASVRRGGGGLGIGLTLVKHLAELHGGKAFAASAGSGEGSVFTVTLPAIEAQDPVAAGVLTAASHARHRILLVDDNADTRKTLFAALELQGHRVFEAADVRDGIRALEAVKPDVAIIDVGLPNLDSYGIAAAARERATAGDGVLLIAMTGFERPETLRRAREAGFDDYFTKPVAPDRLTRLIDAALHAKARRGDRGNPRGNPGQVRISAS